MSDQKYYSVQNRPIDVHAFGEGPKTTMIMAGVHGDEKDGVDVVREVLSRLRSMPKNAFDGHRVVVMPCANPDGYADDTRQNANKIDINRNFPDKTFGTGEKSKKFNGGKVAASEPETKAILGVVAHYKPSLIISLHEALACVNYNGPCIRMSRKISKATGLPVVGDIGYPCPGSMGNYFGFDKRLPVITLELPKENVDPVAYASILLEAIGLPIRNS